MIEKLRKIFKDTIEDNYEYKGNLDYILCSDIITKATDTKKNFRYETTNLCMMKYRFCNRDAILMIFAMPIKTDEDERKINERFFEILGIVEKSFITLDYRQLKEFEEDNYMYFICVKIIENEEDEEYD